MIDKNKLLERIQKELVDLDKRIKNGLDSNFKEHREFESNLAVYDNNFLGLQRLINNVERRLANFENTWNKWAQSQNQANSQSQPQQGDLSPGKGDQVNVSNVNSYIPISMPLEISDPNNGEDGEFMGDFDPKAVKELKKQIETILEEMGKLQEVNGVFGKDLDKSRRNQFELEEKIKKMGDKINQTRISMDEVKADFSNKVNREEYESAVESFLNKEEFKEYKSEMTMSEDAIKKLEIDSERLQKQVKDLEKKLKKDLKKGLARTEKKNKR